MLCEILETYWELSRTLQYASQDDTFLYTTYVHCFALYASLSLVFTARHRYSSSILYMHTDDIIFSIVYILAFSPLW
jgi:hypothetical protein